jgi:site-specific DNA-cytosine methylase
MVKELEPEIFLFENVEPGKKKKTLELKVLLFKKFQPKQKSRNWRFFDSKILLKKIK